MATDHISAQPTDGLSYDPTDPVYWDATALQKETTRIFDICHGCRMCFKYCDSFKDLFSLVDALDGDVRKLTEEQTDKVMDSCFQCKLCEVECPYTPRDSHEFQLDFPKLVHRHRAQKMKKRGLKLRDKVLGNPDLAGTMARMSLGLANVMNRVALHRRMFEAVLGVHRDKLLPDFASSTFESQASKKGRVHEAPTPESEAVLFQTCFVQNNDPDIGHDCCDVMEKNGVKMDCAAGLGCCGMPAWEKGDLDTLRQRAHANLDRLMPWVEKGAKIVALNPTCSMVMRAEYPTLLEGEDRVRAEKLAGSVMEAGEYLWSLRNEPRFNTDFKSTPGDTVSYHAPCHLRAQARGFKGRDLMRKIPGVKPESIIECCGHDGTYAMTVEGFEPSQKYGKKAFDGMKEGHSEVWATDCPLAAIQFQQHAGVKPMHPMSVLARAYREDGFPTKLPPKTEGEK